MLSSIVETLLVKKFDLDISCPTYNIDKGNCLSCVILPFDSSHRESNIWDALLQCRSGEVFVLRAKTWLIHEFDMVILLTKEFGVMAWSSLWVREVPSWILEMPNFTNFDKRCLSSACNTLLVYEYSRAHELNSRTSLLDLPWEKVFEVGLSKRE